MMIRGETIKYSSYKKKMMIEEEKQLEKDIQNIERKITNKLTEISENDINKLEEKNNALADLRKAKMEGVMLRSRCRYEDLGEKTLCLFFKLRKQKFYGQSNYKVNRFKRK